MKQEIRTRIQTMFRILQLALPISAFLCAEASAVPMIPLGPVDVSGTVVKLKWIPEKRIKGIPGMSGSLGVDRIIPAHYLAALRPYAGPDAGLAHLLNHMAGTTCQNPEDPEAPPAMLVVWIRDARSCHLKAGTRVFLPSYTIFGDEGGILAVHDLPVVVNDRRRHGPPYHRPFPSRSHRQGLRQCRK